MKDKFSFSPGGGAKRRTPLVVSVVAQDAPPTIWSKELRQAAAITKRIRSGSDATPVFVMTEAR